MGLLEFFSQASFRIAKGSKKVADESDTWLVSNSSVDKTDTSF